MPVYVAATSLTYPQTTVEDTVETLHGVLVKDPHQVVYERVDDPDLVFSGWVSEDGRFLWISTRRSQDNHNLLSVIDLGDPKEPRPDNPVRHLVEEFRANYSPFGNIGSRVFLRSNEDAPRGKVLAVDLDDPNLQMEGNEYDE